MILNIDSILKSTRKLESHSIPPHFMIVAIKSIVIFVIPHFGRPGMNITKVSVRTCIGFTTASSSLADEIFLNSEEPLYRLQIR